MYLPQMYQDNEETDKASASGFVGEDEDMPLSSPLAGKISSKVKKGSTLSKGGRQKPTPKGPPSEVNDAIMQNLPEGEDEEDDEEVWNSMLDLEVEEVEEDEEEAEEEEYVDDDDDDDDDYEDEWRPAKTASSKSYRSSTGKAKAPAAGKNAPVQDSKKSKQARVSKLERDLEDLSIKDNAPEDPDDSVVVVTKKTKRTKKIVIDSDSEDEQKVKGEDDVPSPVPVVKKKRWDFANVT
jgi:kinesin family protein 20